MSGQRIDTGAEAATSTDADLGEGMGTVGPGAHADPQGHRTSGDHAEMPQPTAARPGAAPAAGAGAADTEGASGLQQAQQTAAAEQHGDADLSGREPAGGRGAAQPSAWPESAGSGASGTRPAHAETGEVSAPPSPERRAEDPGSVAAEFADRADSAPDDEAAHPSL
jgi:hypothetical protein